MAIAHVADSSADLNAPGGTTTIALPAGSTGARVVVVAFGSTRNSTTNPNVVSAPAGWNAIGSGFSANDGTNEVSLYGFWALGSVAALGFTNSQTSGLKQGWAAALFSGVDLSTPIDVVGTGATGSAGLNAASITIVTANAWDVVLTADLNHHEVTGTGLTAADNGATPANASAGVLYNTTPKSTGATGTQNVGISVSDPGDIVAALRFALRPAGPPRPHMMQACFL